MLVSTTDTILLPHEALEGFRVPPTLDAYAQRIQSMFKELSAASISSKTIVSPDTSTVITVSGQRGAGKSTLVRFACGVLARDPSVLLLPMLTPETFSPSDTLLSNLLVKLELLLQQRHPATLERTVDLDGTTLTLHQWLRALQEDETFQRPLQDRPVAIAGATPVDLAHDAVYVSRSGGRFSASLSSFIDVLVRDDATPWQHVVVPIDDPDLNVRLLPRIMLDIRSLAAHRSVIPLVALNYEDARAGLIASLLTNQRGLPDLSRLLDLGFEQKERFASSVDQQMAKALPLAFRVTVAELDRHERLQFSPLGSQTHLHTLLHRLVAATSGASPAVANDVFSYRDIHGEGRPTYLANAIPSVPRELEAFYHIANRADLKSREGAAEGLRQLVELMQTLTLAQTPPSIRTSPPITFVSVGNGVGVVFDMSHLRFTFSNVGQTTRLTRNEEGALQDTHLEVQRVGDVFSELVQVDSPQPYQRAPAALTALVLLTHELTVSQKAFRLIEGDVRTLGGSSMMGGAFEVSFVIDGRLHETDNRFLYVPPWGTQLDGMRYIQAWNADVDAVESLEMSTASAEALIAWLTLAHLHRVVQSINDVRRKPSRWSALDSDSLRVLAIGSRRSMDLVDGSVEALTRSLAATYRRSLDEPNQRRRAFVGWYETEMLHTIHPGLVGEARAERLARSWRRNVSRAERLDVCRQSLAASIMARFSDRSDLFDVPAWARAYLDLVALMHPGAHHDLQEELASSQQRPDPIASEIGRAAAGAVEEATPVTTERRPAIDEEPQPLVDPLMIERWASAPTASDFRLADRLERLSLATLEGLAPRTDRIARTRRPST